MKNYKINIGFTLLIALLFFACSEDRIGENETGTIRGTVVMAGSNTPIENVRISTQPTTSTVFTDADGKFIIENVPVGDLSVQARKDEYIAAFEPASVLPNLPVDVVLELETSLANNRPPTSPILINPAENELLQTTTTQFKWSASDPDGDPLKYSIQLRNDLNDTVEVFTAITDTVYTYSELLLGAKYFWQVFASDDINPQVASEIGSFRVIAAPVDNRYLFVRNINGNNVIYSSDITGNEFQLTSEDKNSYRPVRNVGANRIAFFQSTGGQIDLFTMARDGTDKQQVTSNIKPNGFNLNYINFSWPNNSDKLYFTSLNKLYSIRTTGQDLALVYQTTDGSLISEVDVNGDTIALKTNDFNGYNVSIFTINFAGTVTNIVLTGFNGATSGLDLSANNQKLLYGQDISGNTSPDYRIFDSHIMQYIFSTMTPTDLSTEKVAGTNDLEPRYAPNEAQVIFTNTSNDGLSQKNILTLNVLDNERQDLFMNAFMPNWE